MLLEALVDQLNQRFVHEKRASVCLWFDEHRELGRVLPRLREHLALLEPAPFVLLEYDAAALHGQIWLKCLTHTLPAVAERPHGLCGLRIRHMGPSAT